VAARHCLVKINRSIAREEPTTGETVALPYPSCSRRSASPLATLGLIVPSLYSKDGTSSGFWDSRIARTGEMAMIIKALDRLTRDCGGSVASCTVSCTIRSQMPKKAGSKP
jgi:hypothetical protein